MHMVRGMWVDTLTCDCSEKHGDNSKCGQLFIKRLVKIILALKNCLYNFYC
jgi:hypothetical protein